jgi:hypothetical protein
LTCSNTQTNYNFATTGTYDEDTLKTILGNTITDVDSRATSYTVSLQQISGNTGQWYVNGNLIGYANSAYTLSNSKATINSANLQYLPALDNTANVTISYKQYKINSVFGNIAQANVSAVYSIGNTNSEISNMIARTITANAVANIFATSTPAISDGSDVGQTYTITLSSPVGRFGNTANNALAANTYSYTGNITQVNNEFTNMKFVNDYGIGAQTSSFTYTQSRDGTAQVNTSPVLTINAGSVANAYVRTITANSTFTPSSDQLMFGNIQLLVIGGGGSGFGFGWQPNGFAIGLR